MSDGESEARVRLDFGEIDHKTPPKKPAVDAATILEVAEQTGFREAKPVEPKQHATRPRKSASKEVEPRRLQRSRSDRIHPFSVRLNRQTVDAIYDYAERKGCALAQVIEDMVELVKAEEAKKR